MTRWFHPAFALCLWAAAPLVGPLHAADAPKGERYALLVGVRQYSDAAELRELPYAENDVTELAQVLRDGGYKADNVVLMTQATGTAKLRFLPLKDRIQTELDLLLKNRSEDDTVLLAFAGHGVVFKDDADSYFCPADAKLDDKAKLLSLSEVYRQLEKCKAGTKVLLVDACRNNPLADKSRAPAKLDLDSVTRPPEPAKDGGVAAFFSCSRGQKAYEDDRNKHGAFFRYVIDGLKGEAAPDKDNVTLLELGAYVQRRVADFARAEYGADQKPDMSNASVQGAAPLVAATDYVRAYRLGKKLQGRKEYEQAEAHFTEALRLNPGYVQALADRAAARDSLKQHDKAIADCDEAIHIDPRCARAFNIRGNAWQAKGKYDQAIADYDEAVRLDPRFAEAFSDRAFAWMAKGDYAKGFADCDEAIRVDPKHPDAYLVRSRLWRLKGELDKAIADADEAIRLDPTMSDAFSYRGKAWNVKNEFDKSMADFDEAIRLDARNAEAYYWRGRTWAAKKEYDKAIADFDAAARLKPAQADIFNERGVAWSEKREYDKAIPDFDEALRLDPKNSLTFYNRGLAWEAKREYQRALDDYNECLRLNPRYPWAFRGRGRIYQAMGDDAAAKAEFETADRLAKEP